MKLRRSRAAEPAPVVKAGPAPEPIVVQAIEDPPAKPYRDGDWRPEFHVVKKGETLYSIALDYGQEYRELAAWNNLEDPGVIKVDQRLRLFPPEGRRGGPCRCGKPAGCCRGTGQERAQGPQDAVLGAGPGATEDPGRRSLPRRCPPPALRPRQASAQARRQPPWLQRPSSADGKLTWEWPANGKLGYGFGQGSNQKGIGIDGKAGEAVLAGAPGKVVYSGSGLRGYGKLVIIKHNASYLSVYAHNSQILVKEGQSVAKGQKIAEMGNTDSSRGRPALRDPPPRETRRSLCNTCPERAS